MVKQCGIYSITNKIDGKQYWGSTIDYKKRIKQHITTLSNNKHHNIYLQRAFNKYGIDNFKCTFEMEVCCEQLLTVEQICLDLNPNGYNIAINAKSPTKGIKMSKDTKNKISISSTGNPLKKHSQEWKDSHSFKMIGNNYGKGRKHTQEWKDNLSKRMMGNTLGAKKAK